MSIKVRITLLSVITTLVVVGILLALGMISSNKMEARVADAVVVGNQLLWEQLIENERIQIATHIESFNNEFDLRGALKVKDKAEIAKYADRYVNLTQGANSYHLLQIFDPDKALLYSSGQVTRLQGIDALVNSVLASLEIHSAILATAEGETFNVVAFPSKSRRRTLGVGVYAKRLDGVLQSFTAQSGFGASLFDSFGQQRHLENLPEIPEIATYLPPPGARKVQKVSLDSRRFVLSIQPITDLGDQAVAHLMVARDDTARLSELAAFSRNAYLLASFVVLSGIFVLFIALRRYLAPLQGAADSAARIAEGDLTADVAVTGVAEIRVVEHAMQDMARRLKRVLVQVSDTSTQVSEAAGGMTGTASDTHAELREQSDKVDKVSLSLVQMASAIEQIAQVTEEAAASGYSVQQKADEGEKELQGAANAGRRMSEDIDAVGEAIAGLTQHVEAVTGIVNVINAIAEQTNLLALNAAIEAARAGEQGRGFAVVADEVRSLASRTQDSTQEIESIIQRLQEGSGKAVSSIDVTREAVYNNAEHVDRVLHHFDQIRERIDVMVGAGQETASAVEEQSAMAREVSENMDAIQQSFERTRLRADDLLETSESLDRLSSGLEEITHRFRYGA